MLKDILLNFFNNNPRFNVAIIKNHSVDPKELAVTLSFAPIDIKEEILADRVALQDVAGYTELVDVIKNLADKNRSGIVINNIDILLSALDKSKRKSFFEKVLTTRFKANTVLYILIFGTEVPLYEDYNHGIVVNGG